MTIAIKIHPYRYNYWPLKQHQIIKSIIFAVEINIMA